MLAHALLAVIAATERAQRPPQPGLIALTCNEIRHLFTKLITQPAHRLTVHSPGHSGDAAINTTPEPATTAIKKPNSHDHDLRWSTMLAASEHDPRGDGAMASESASSLAGAMSVGWPSSALTCLVIRPTISGWRARSAWSTGRWCRRFAGSPPVNRRPEPW